MRVLQQALDHVMGRLRRDERFGDLSHVKYTEIKVRSALQKARRRGAAEFAHLSAKQQDELKFWSEMVFYCTLWYRGILPSIYGTPRPSRDEMINEPDLVASAIKTWYRVVIGKYKFHLEAGPDFFAGKSVLDIGCGPIPQLLTFRDCRRFGVDQLIDEYKILGFPLDDYASEMTYLKGSSESIPADDNSYDAVVAVNALDHVDNFEETAREICRVLRPGGMLRFEVHYHEPTVGEPLQLTDEQVRDHLGHLKIRKIREMPGGKPQLGTLVLWSTDG